MLFLLKERWFMFGPFFLKKHMLTITIATKIYVLEML